MGSWTPTMSAPEPIGRCGWFAHSGSARTQKISNAATLLWLAASDTAHDMTQGEGGEVREVQGPGGGVLGGSEQEV